MMELQQKAIETVITAMLLDMTRFFGKRAQILNVGDKRYWEERLTYKDKQFTERSGDIVVSFDGNISVDQSQNTHPIDIKYLFIDDNKKINDLVIRAKRKTVTVALSCKINTTTFPELMLATEELIDKTTSARTFNYVLFGKQFSANYRINYDADSESKANFSTEENTENGFNVSFTLSLEFHYYAPTFKAAAITRVVTVYHTVITVVETGAMVPQLGDDGQPMLDDNGNQILVPETTEVEVQVPVLTTDAANIVGADEDIITRLVHNIYVKHSNDVN